MFCCLLAFLRSAAAQSVADTDLQKQGLALADHGRYPEAVAVFRRALEGSPNDPEILNNLGVALRKQGDAAASLSALEAAVRLRPSDARLLSNLALTLRALGRLNRAVAVMQSACALMPADGVLHRNLATLLSEAGDDERAQRELEKAVQLSPSDAENHQSLGRVLAKRKRTADAFSEYSTAARLAPNAAAIRLDFGELYEAMNDAARATDQYRTCLAHRSAKRKMPRGPRAFVGADDPASAEAELCKALAIDPESGEAHRGLGSILRKQNKLPEAVSELQQAAALLPDDCRAALRAGPSAAESAADPMRLRTRFRLAQQLEQRQKDAAVADRRHQLCEPNCSGKATSPAAEATLREAVSLAPRDPLAHYHYGLSFLVQNKFQEAIAEFRTTLDLRPDDADTLYYLGRALLEAKQAAERRSIAASRIGNHPGDAHARNVLAVALARTKDFSAAAAELERALGHRTG